MAFTYDLTQLSTNKLYQVRLEIGDTDPTLKTNRRLEDEEINYWLGIVGNDVLQASVRALENLISRFARKEIGTTGHQDDRRFEQLERRLIRLRQRLANESGWKASGQSIADKTAVELNTDRVAPAFKTGLVDYPGTGGPSNTGPSAATDQTSP